MGVTITDAEFQAIAGFMRQVPACNAAFALSQALQRSQDEAAQAADEVESETPEEPESTGEPEEQTGEPVVE